MSILQIGAQSRYLQISPGCRKYISPFLLSQQRHQIQILKQESQVKYRQELFNQIKQKQQERKRIKNKEQQADIKHQRQFYEKIKKYQQRDQTEPQNKFRIKLKSSPGVILNKRPLSEPKSQKKSNKMSDRSNNSQFYLKNPQDFSNISIFSKRKYNTNIQSEYLKNQSLIQIGHHLKKRSSQNLNNFNLNKSSNNKSLSSDNIFSQSLDYPQEMLTDLRDQLKQKQYEVYQMLHKSKQFLKNSRVNPIKEMKKRLRTEPIYIPEDNEIEQDEFDNALVRYRIRTQFGTCRFYDNNKSDEKFYKLPSIRSSLNSQQRIQNGFKTYTLGQQQSTIQDSSRQNMIKIEQNPEIQNEQQQFDRLQRRKEQKSPRFSQLY